MKEADRKMGIIMPVKPMTPSLTYSYVAFGYEFSLHISKSLKKQQHSDSEVKGHCASLFRESLLWTAGSVKDMSVTFIVHLRNCTNDRMSISPLKFST